MASIWRKPSECLSALPIQPLAPVIATFNFRLSSAFSDFYQIIHAQRGYLLLCWEQLLCLRGVRGVSIQFYRDIHSKDTMTVSASIFKAYDIRGIVDKTLTDEAVRLIGQALASEGIAKGVKQMVVGRDGRLSGPRFADQLALGIQAAGVDVIDIGQVTTPIVYYATYELNTGSGVAITGSHNPPEYNGLKMMLAGETLYGDAIQALLKRIETNNLVTAAVPGKRTSTDMRERYLKRVLGDVKLARPMKIAIDCGNGVAGAFAADMFKGLGCEVQELFCEVDGNFPNHHPDPAHIENLQDLIRCLKDTDAEIGIAFDGDGDRLGVVTKSGAVIFPDRQMMLFAEDVLSRNPGAEILFDVKCSRNLGNYITAKGGRPLMWKTGHSLVKAKMRETGAPLGGEMSGHIFIKDRWYGFDDGLYAGARLLEILSKVKDPNATLENLPNSPTTPELQMATAEGENHALIAKLQANGGFESAQKVVTIDGVRAEYADGFGLARASNTTPVVVMRFEADTDEALLRIQGDFKRAVLAVKPSAVLPF
jgi:phosphomannomutase / phosphoglucomutase